jgi:hypothetical protein
MKKPGIWPKGCNSVYKVGEYEFLVRIGYSPLFMITKLVMIRISLTHPKGQSDCWYRSVIVRHSEAADVVQRLMTSYLEGVDYFNVMQSRGSWSNMSNQIIISIHN